MTVSARLYRRGEWQRAEDGSETVVDVWEIVCSSETETITNVLSASGLPSKGDPHEEKISAVLISDDLRQHDEVLTLWYYTARYSTRIETREYTAYNVQRVKGGMKSGSKDVPAFFDSRGYPLVNSAGDLYPGLTRKRRLRVFNCTANFTTIPNWFFEYAGTINDAAVTILGKVYPAGTCMLGDLDCPDEPTTDRLGDLYWPVTFSVVHDPDGYFILLPNKGMNELVYQVRDGVDSEWSDTTVTAYTAKTPTTDRRIIKRRILTDEGQDVADDIWLNADGQATKVVSLNATAIGTANTTAGSKSITLATGAFDVAAHKGAMIKILGAGPLNRPLVARIDAVASTTAATLAIAAFTTVAAKTCYVSGAIVNQFVMDDLADWSTLPLPNNHPGA
jgi:hypothetical protein